MRGYTHAQKNTQASSVVNACFSTLTTCSSLRVSHKHHPWSMCVSLSSDLCVTSKALRSHCFLLGPSTMLCLYCLLDVCTNITSCSHWTCTKNRSATSTRTGLSGVSLISNEASSVVNRPAAQPHLSVSAAKQNSGCQFHTMQLSTE